MTPRGADDQIHLAILQALEEMGHPVGASRLQKALAARGLFFPTRTVRHYLLQLDRMGLTKKVSRRAGREITDRGREEISRAGAARRIGIISARLEELVYQMDFDLAHRRGAVIANIAVIRREHLAHSLRQMAPVFNRGLGVGRLAAVSEPGERFGRVTVLPGEVAIATVCSAAINGILLQQGIPTSMRFGGLLEMENYVPRRFVDLVEYAGSTLDPAQIFIQAGMTRITQCARSGSGLVGASFREIPAVARQHVRELSEEMKALGLGGIIAIGYPNQPLVDIPVGDGRAGMVVVAGLNPLAAIHEAGIPIKLFPLNSLMDFQRFQPFENIFESIIARHL